MRVSLRVTLSPQRLFCQFPLAQADVVLEDQDDDGENVWSVKFKAINYVVRVEKAWSDYLDQVHGQMESSKNVMISMIKKAEDPGLLTYIAKQNQLASKGLQPVHEVIVDDAIRSKLEWEMRHNGWDSPDLKAIIDLDCQTILARAQSMVTGVSS